MGILLVIKYKQSNLAINFKFNNNLYIENLLPYKKGQIKFNDFEIYNQRE